MAKDVKFLDEFGSDKAGFEEVKLDAITDRLQLLGMQYAQLLADSLKDKEADSSGEGGDSIKALEVQVNGSVYTIEIEGKEYLSYIDEGVDGWEKSRGSRFKFKNNGAKRNRGNGDAPKGKMVKSIKAYLKREGKMQQSKYAVMNKKRQPKRSIEDTNATRVAYMIKRFGIKPNHFWRDATIEMEKIIERELGEVVKISIINNIMK